MPCDTVATSELLAERSLLCKYPDAPGLVEGLPAAAQMVLRVGYRGAGFAGFALQTDQRTVAGEILHACETMLHRPCELVCAGRTDAGVHALGQVVSIPVTAEELSRSSTALQRGLQALVGEEISIQDVLAAPAPFSARFDADWRSYRYRIYASPARPILSADHAWWHRGTLDVEAMDAAARSLVGEHDFMSFCKAVSARGKSTTREVLSCRVTRATEAGESLVMVDVVGSAFLHSMVRTIVGTLAEVGRHHKDISWVDDVLAARDRRAAGQCAPAKGLTFCEVGYPDGLLMRWPGDTLED